MTSGGGGKYPWQQRWCRLCPFNVLIITAILQMQIRMQAVKAFLFYPRGGSIGYLAAVAMPLDLPQRDVYVAFNFEANYGVPPNTTYLEWVDRWNLAKYKFGIGNNVTGIDGRQLHQQEQQQEPDEEQHHHRYTRDGFYRSVVGYANEFGLNGRACLLRTICEVAASNLDEHNGLFGSIFKILFMPSTSAPEKFQHDGRNKDHSSLLYEAEQLGRDDESNCTQFFEHCPEGILNMVSEWI